MDAGEGKEGEGDAEDIVVRWPAVAVDHLTKLYSNDEGCRSRCGLSNVEGRAARSVSAVRIWCRSRCCFSLVESTFFCQAFDRLG